MPTWDPYRESAAYLAQRLSGFKPEILIILGSGLGALADEVEAPVCVPYGEIPHFKVSTASGHAGRYVFGRFAGRDVVIMQGRLHLYEGYAPEDLVRPVRAAFSLGARSMLITNAAGGVNLDFQVGDLMMLTDFIKFAAPDPLTGPNRDAFGPRFPDMSRVFDRAYMDVMRAAARGAGVVLREGVYFYMPGPQFETPAEIRAIRILGGDAVGMSTVHECIAARHAGMRVAGLSLITNMAAGVLDKPLSSQEVNDAAEAAAPKFSALLRRTVREM